jgi:hypothetical protein
MFSCHAYSPCVASRSGCCKHATAPAKSHRVNAIDLWLAKKFHHAGTKEAKDTTFTKAQAMTERLVNRQLGGRFA